MTFLLHTKLIITSLRFTINHSILTGFLRQSRYVAVPEFPSLYRIANLVLLVLVICLRLQQSNKIIDNVNTS